MEEQQEDDTGRQIEKLMKEEVSAHHIAGANVLVSVHGQTIYRESLGMADLEQKSRCRKIRFLKCSP